MWKRVHSENIAGKEKQMRNQFENTASGLAEDFDPIYLNEFLFSIFLGFNWTAVRDFWQKN